ncbi:bystin [Procambarus clarkii]|uniref:bystin n=1 Tax=Procambarus clarkii TaxID=6728 RepID=UPI00374247F8
MGKIKKLKKLGGKVSRPCPLDEQLTRDELARPTGRTKIRSERKDGDDEYVEGQLGRIILKQSVAQLKEMEEEMEEEEFPPLGAQRPRFTKRPTAVKLSSKSGKDGESEESSDEEVDETHAAVPQNVDKVVKEFEDELNLAEEDKKVLEHFMNKDALPQRKLADLFRDKITEKQTEIKTQVDASSVQTVNLSPEVQEMCAQVGKVLAKYRSGPLPKMFKVIPKMRSWEELVYLTNPDKWSAAAMYQAVRIFVSNLKEAMAQRFFNLVLLPRVRDDISFYKRLNYHLYQALCKALFKPAAFFKGVLLPLCMSGNCTLREAVIVGSVLAKNHIPILHSAAAILKIAEMDYTGPNSIFLRIFFDKKYALPYRVIDACVYHYLKFEHDRRDLPVLWHQSLITFIQRYKEDLSPDQKQSLLDVVRFHTHHAITGEIRRELLNSKSRGEDDSKMVVE